MTKGIEGRDSHLLIIQICRLILFWSNTARMLYILISSIYLLIYTILICLPGMCLFGCLLGVEDGLRLLKLWYGLYKQRRALACNKLGAHRIAVLR